MIGIFINMWAVDETFVVALLKKASGTLRRVARLLFKELLVPGSIVGAPWSHFSTTVADWRYRPLGDGLKQWASRGGRVDRRFSCTSIPIGLIWRDASFIVLRGDRISRPRAEARDWIGHGLLFEAFEIQIHIR